MKVKVFVLSDTELKKYAKRYLYWRDKGVAISDAPIDYIFGVDLDNYTDKLIKKEPPYEIL